MDPASGRISVWNDGAGIPIQMHKEHHIYVPELIFGNLLTGSNFDDDQKKTTGGRNGFGAKVRTKQQRRDKDRIYVVYTHTPCCLGVGCLFCFLSLLALVLGPVLVPPLHYFGCLRQRHQRFCLFGFLVILASLFVLLRVTTSLFSFCFLFFSLLLAIRFTGRGKGAGDNATPTCLLYRCRNHTVYRG